MAYEKKKKKWIDIRLFNKLQIIKFLIMKVQSLQAMYFFLLNNLQYIIVESINLSRIIKWK